MILRSRQRTFVDRCIAALKKHGNTVGVAATGAGKTVMMAAVADERIKDGAKAAIGQHRDELVSQNNKKFLRYSPRRRTSVYDGTAKDWSGECTFFMVQSAATPTGLASMPTLDFIAADECHHTPAPIWLEVLNRAEQLNPRLVRFGVTATAGRGDKKGLREAGFTNCADQISISELIAAGHLVRPRTYVLDVGDTDTSNGVTPAIEAVIRHWQEKADDRQSVFFCSSREQSKTYCKAFADAGVSSIHVDGEMPKKERAAALEAYARNEYQCLFNVDVATEGWDHQPVSCVVLLRKRSFLSAYIQMVGRGLRTVCPEEFPGVHKTDCVVLDFGESTKIHGTLEQSVNLATQPKGEAPTKECPDCHSLVPATVRECPICSFAFPQNENGRGPIEVSDFTMTEVELIDKSPFAWVDLFGDGSCMFAGGFRSWAGVFWWNGEWHAVGGKQGERAHHLALGEKVVAIASADDWLLDHEDEAASKKTAGWMKLPPSEKQLEALKRAGHGVMVFEEAGDFGYQVHLKKYGRADVVEVDGQPCNRYKAALLTTWAWNKTKIRELIIGKAAA